MRRLQICIVCNKENKKTCRDKCNLKSNVSIYLHLENNKLETNISDRSQFRGN